MMNNILSISLSLELYSGVSHLEGLILQLLDDICSEMNEGLVDDVITDLLSPNNHVYFSIGTPILLNV